MSRVLITGGRGLVGRPTVAALLAAGHQVVSVTRSPRVGAPDVALTEVSVGDLGATNDWTRLLRGVDAVVHLAGRRPHADDEGTDAIESRRERSYAEDLMKVALRYVEVYKAAKERAAMAAMGLDIEEDE